MTFYRAVGTQHDNETNVTYLRHD